MSIKSSAALLLFVSLLMIGCNREKNPVIQVLPGKYKVTANKNSYDGKGVVSKITEICYADTEYQPFKQKYESDTCEISDFDRIGSSVRYNIYCSEGVHKGMKGAIEYGYLDETVRLSFEVLGTNKSEVFSFSILSEAVWIGECEDKTIEDKTINVF